MRAKAAKKAPLARPRAQPARRKKQGKGKKWFLGFDNFRAGSGDAPSSKRSDLVSLAPAEYGTQQSASNKVQTIAQDELVAIVQGSVSFQCTSWQVQPGLVANFPWLAQLSALYQKYRIRSMVFYFKPTVSQYNSLGQQGRVVLCFDTDALSPLLQSTQQAENLSPHVDGMPYEKMYLELPAAKITPPDGKFVRTGPAPAGSDIKTYDAGIVYFCTEGLGGSGAIGELRVKYVVDLVSPMLPNSVPPQVNYRVTQAYASVPISASTATWTQIPINTYSTIGNGLGLSMDAGGNVTFPSGLFNIVYKVKFTPSAFSLTLMEYEIRVNGAPVGWSSFVNTPNPGSSAGQNCWELTMVRNLTQGSIVTFWGRGTFASGTLTIDGSFIATLC